MSEKVKLGDVCKVQGGYAFKSKQFQKNKIPIVRIGNIQDNQVEIDYSVCYTEEFLNMHPEFEIQDEDILIAMSGATVGKIGKYKNDKKALLNQRVGNFITTEKLEKGYLYFLLQSPLFEKYILNNAFGCAQPNISSKKIEEFEFYLYDNKEQMEITNQLDKNQKIVDIRKKQIEQLNKLIKSQFVEMFENCKNIELIGKKIDICRGASPRPINNFITEDVNGENWIKIGDASENSLYITSTKEKITSEGANKSRRVYKGDFILSNSMSYGRPYILGINGCVHDGWLIMSKFQNTFNELYLYYAIRDEYVQNQFAGKVNGATVKNLNSDLVKASFIKIPPIEAQNRFAEFVKQIDKQKFEIQKSLEEMKKLQESLMNKYFG